MKNYEQLKDIAEIYTHHIEKVPGNPFRLANQLQMKCKTKFEFLNDYKNSYCPLYSYPAILCNTGTEDAPDYIIYYDESSEFWRFYVFHELSHYLLGHDSDDPGNEKEANMLACLLIAPPNMIPSTFQSANDLCFHFHIPIGRAEEYWEYLNVKSKHIKSKMNPLTTKILKVSLVSAISIFVLVFALNKAANFDKIKADNSKFSTHPQSYVEFTAFSPASALPTPDTTYQNTSNPNLYVVTSSGERYHLPSCRHVEGKSDLKALTPEEATNKGYTPCKDCLPQ